MPLENNQRITRRRSSAGPTPPRRPSSSASDFNGRQNQGPRPTFLTLRDHGKVFVADLPNLSDGQLAHISKEANEVLSSLEKRLFDLENNTTSTNQETDTLIKASTKRDVTLRFIKSIEEEQEHRRNNPALRDAATESLPRTFLEVARHRLPGATFDSLLREALEACSVDDTEKENNVRVNNKDTVKIMDIPSSSRNTSLVVNINPDSDENDENL